MFRQAYPGLGFHRGDRDANVQRIAERANQLVNADKVVICAVISPYRQSRDAAKALIGAHRFLEVYVRTPIAVCEARDPKGLYRRARAGEVRDFTGLDSPYEPPLAPDVIIDTTTNSPELSADTILEALRERELMPTLTASLL
jgi:adenylyl-sulfate kinase